MRALAALHALSTSKLRAPKVSTPTPDPKKIEKPIGATPRLVCPVRLTDIAVDSSRNPRKSFYDKDVKDLAASFQKLGQLEPVLVYPYETGKTGPNGEKFVLFVGEMRYRAAKLLEWTNIEAAICTPFQRDAEKVDDAALAENRYRYQLTPYEVFQEVIRRRKTHGYTVLACSEHLNIAYDEIQIYYDFEDFLAPSLLEKFSRDQRVAVYFDLCTALLVQKREPALYLRHKAQEKWWAEKDAPIVRRKGTGTHAKHRPERPEILDAAKAIRTSKVLQRADGKTIVMLTNEVAEIVAEVLQWAGEHGHVSPVVR